jgi:putative lipoprotein
LYKGGMWFREKSLIRMLTSFQPEQGPGYTDMRENFNNLVVTPTQGAPVGYFANRYFFLPALGQYGFGQLTEIGQSGYYWSSSASPGDSNWAYSLQFSKSQVIVNTAESNVGFYVMTFQ